MHNHQKTQQRAIEGRTISFENQHKVAMLDRTLNTGRKYPFTGKNRINLHKIGSSKRVGTSAEYESDMMMQEKVGPMFASYDGN